MVKFDPDIEEGPGTTEDVRAALRKRTSTINAHKSGLTLEMFETWTDQCRVRKVHEEFAPFAHAAEEENKPVDEVLAEQGYNNMDEFMRECPRFPISCPLADLGELGSGFVMYFHLLRFFVVILLGLVLLSLPALVIYAAEDSIVLYYWHQWKKGGWLSDNEDDPEACSCLGYNLGTTGNSGNASYGTSCGVWDLEWCLANLDSPDLGKWCCRSWCFAGTSCQVPKLSATLASPSLANEHVGDELVRATTECEQDAALLAEACAELPDVRYGETDRTSLFTWKIWLTPGNLGPNQGDNETPLVFYLVAVVALCFATMGMSNFLQYTEFKVDEKVRMPCDFAILVTGLPKEVTSEREIAKFFEEHAVQGQHDTKVTSVVIGWNMASANAKQRELARLRKQVEKGDLAEEDLANAKKRIAELRDGFFHSELTSDGVAVVVFRWRSDLLACVDRWSTSIWSRWFNLEKGSWCFGEELPKFHGNTPIKVRRAPNPGDINWYDLGAQGFSETWWTYIRGHGLMLLLIFISFLVTWGANKLQETIRSSHAGSYTFQGLSLLPAGVVAGVNELLKQAAYYLSLQECHRTMTDQDFAQAYKMSYAMIINTSGVIFWVNMQPREWYLRGGLADDIVYLMAVDAVVTRLCFLIDYTYWTYSWYYRREVSEETVAELDRTIKASIAQSSEEEVEALLRSKAKVQEIKTLFEPMQLYNPDRYARALSTFFISVFYAPLLPLSPLIGIAALTLQYFIDKALLLRWCKRPSPQNNMLALSSLRAVKYLAPIGFCTSVFVFLAPAWKDPSVVRTFSILGIILYFVIDFVVPERVWCAIFHWFKPQRQLPDDEAAKQNPKDDYYKAQYLWGKDMKYHKDQVMYNEITFKLNPPLLKEDEDIREFKEMAHAAMELRTRMRATKTGAKTGGPPTSSSSGRGKSLTPATIGATSTLPGAEGPTTGISQSSVASSRPEPTVSAPSVAPPPATSSSKSSAHWPARTEVGSGVSFEFETGRGFQRFGDDCQNFLEDSYQKFMNGTGEAQIRVHTGGRVIMVDLASMTQNVENASARVRKIRRLEKE